MSIHVENSLRKNASALEQSTHYVPCSVGEDGPANVSKYFEPTVEKDINGELTASFRGHPLNGSVSVLPPGYRAVLMTESKRPLTEAAERKFQIVGGFKEFVNWNWDKKPSNNDAIAKAMAWVDIADAIHGD